MIETRQPFEFEDWKRKYRVVLCLKSTKERETWLLEERNGTKRCILKKEKEAQGELLKAEYELLCELSKQQKIAEFDFVEFRQEEGWEYLLREYVQGMTLEELIEKEGTLTVEEAVALGEKLCRKTAIFHNRNPRIIHRDIKPENIVVTPSGKIRLIDFETARSYKQGQKTDTIRMGTRGYAAPEQFGFGQTDARSDIYAIGKVLLYMVTAGCEEDDLKLLQKGSEKRLKRVIRKCLAYDPSERYQDAEQLAAALARIRKYGGRNLPVIFIPAGNESKSCLHGLDKCREGQYAATGQRCKLDASVRAAGLFSLAVLSAVMCIAVIYVGIRNFDWKREGGAEPPEISKADVEETSDSVKEGAAEGTDEIIRWNPYEYEEDVNTILQMYSAENYDAMSEACEALVEKLGKSECIGKVIPVSYEKMTEKELETYHRERMGYEYIADRLSYGNGLALRRLGSYEQSGREIAGAIREDLEYFYVNEEGSETGSELYVYLTEGSSKNMDGCIIELLDCINRGLS